jgi:GNAT superfamily N-acetyltransferase
MQLATDEMDEVDSEGLGFTIDYADEANFLRAVIEKKSPGILMVAEEDGRVIGNVCFVYQSKVMDRSNWSAHEAAWYISPEYRGRGLGREVRHAAQEAVLKDGIRKISLGVLVGAGHEAKIDKLKAEGFKPVRVDMLKIFREEGEGVA